MNRATCGGLTMLLLAVPGIAPAQSCRPELVRAGLGRQQALGPGRTNFFASGGVLIRCIGQSTTLQADSVAHYSDLSRLDFVGRVRFRDDTTSLTADRAQYFTADERLEAQGHVRLVNRVTGSMLEGPSLTYWRAVPQVRDTTEMLAAGRPTVTYRSAGDTAASPYRIVGDRVRLRGESQAWAAGRVEVTREEFTATSDSASMRFRDGEGVLVGHAMAQATDSGGYTMRGREIAYRLQDDRLHWVQARDSAEATSADWQVAGDTIGFDVANDHLQGGRVWGRSVRPRASSALQTVVGDSLAIDAPDEELREVRAFGAGRATARRDSSTAEPDWVAGDTVVAQFGPKAEGPGRSLVELRAAGAAQAYYHVYEQGKPDLPPGIAYSRGMLITITFARDELARVDVVGGADGVYLVPAGRQGGRP